MKLHCTIAGEQFTFFKDKAVFWHSAKTLIVSDIHFGKGQSFRSFGIPVPSGGTEENLARLDALIEQCGPMRILILGDFLHSKQGRSETLFSTLKKWRQKHSEITVTLVSGNHDVSAGSLPHDIGIELVVDFLEEGPFVFSHEDMKHSKFVFSGHIHPCLRLSDRAGGAVRLPCFHRADNSLTLPAFGEFTGMHGVKPVQGDVLYLCHPEGVREVRF